MNNTSSSSATIPSTASVSPTSASSQPAADFRGKMVWIVDDDKSIRFILEKVLLKAQFKTHCFTHAEEMLRALSEETPDIIFTDVRMPGMDGYQLINKVQASHPTLPVVIMTAHSDLDSAVEAFQSGAFEFASSSFT